jgi:hypothetical protein
MIQSTLSASIATTFHALKSLARHRLNYVWCCARRRTRSNGKVWLRPNSSSPQRHPDLEDKPRCPRQQRDSLLPSPMSEEQRPQWFPIPTGGDGSSNSSSIRSGPLYVSNETTSLPTENLLVLVDRLPPPPHDRPPPHQPRLAQDLDVALAQEEEHRYYESFYGPRRCGNCTIGSWPSRVEH